MSFLASISCIGPFVASVFRVVFYERKLCKNTLGFPGVSSNPIAMVGRGISGREHEGMQMCAISNRLYVRGS